MSANYNVQTRKFLLDEVYTNYGITDIPAGTGVIQDPSNDDGIVVPTASGGVAGTIGLTVETIPAGKQGRVATYGVAVGTAYGTISAGDFVMVSDTALHLGQVVASGSADEQLGKAVSSASDGFPVRVRLFAAKNA